MRHSSPNHPDQPVSIIELIRTAPFLIVLLSVVLWLSGCGAVGSSSSHAGGSGSGGGGTGGGGGGGSSGGSSPAAFLYGANYAASSLSGYEIKTDGSLTPISGFPFAAAQNPQSLASGGNYLLVANGFSPGANNGEIVLYRIGPRDGKLTQASSFMASANYVALTPKGDFAYDSESGIAAYSTAGGKLTPLPSSPYSYVQLLNGNGIPLTPDRMMVDASGKFLYASFYPANFSTPYGDFGVVPIHADGSLGAFPSGSPVPSCNIAGGLAAAPSHAGKAFVYESCGDPNADTTFHIMVFTVDQGTGTVNANASFTGTAKPGGLASGLAVDPSGKWLIGLDVNDDLLYVLSINPNTGSLTQAHTFPTGHRPNSVTFDDSGKFLYVSNGDYPAAMGGGSNDVSAYAFDPNTGNATQLNGSPYAAGAGVTSLVIAH